MSAVRRIVGARVLDPATGTDAVLDLWLTPDAVLTSPPPGAAEGEVLDLTGKVVTPAFVDLHVHFREPGGEESETIASGCAAARAGGYGDVFAMANTRPVNDSPEITRRILDAAARSGTGVRVHPVTAATRRLLGAEPAPWRAQVEAGCAAISDDGRPVADLGLLEQVLRAARELDVPYLSHAECPELFGGVVHAGRASEALGLRGIPAECESRAVERELDLAGRLGARIHVCHVSTRASLDALAAARSRGAAAPAVATPHHLLLDDREFLERGADPDLKMNPPLRSPEDREALVEALRTGAVTAIGTDHAPHAPRLKAAGLAAAPFGVIGVETAFAVLHEELVRVRGWPLATLVHRLTLGPATIGGIAAGRLFEGPPRLAWIDPDAPWEVRPESFRSLSRNCPFARRRGVGRVAGTVFGASVERSDAPGRSPSA